MARVQRNKLIGKTNSYPDGLLTIPLASYMRITRYEYMEGLKRARENGMQGAEAALGNEGSGLQTAKNALAGTLKFTYGNFLSGAGDGAAFDSEIEKLARDSTRRSGGGSNNRPKRSSGANQNTMKKVKAGDYEDIFKDGPVTLTDGTVVDNAEQLAQMKNEAHDGKDSKRAIYHLPMPNEFQYEYSADWGNKFRMGTMARLLDSPAALGQMALTAAGSAALNAGGQLMNAAGGEFLGALGGGTGLNMGGVLGAAFKGAVNPLGSTDGLSTNNVLGLAGLAPNENAITMFSRVTERKFNLSFEFFARDEIEAGVINGMINAFKTAMHPTTTAKGTGGVLGFPDIFMLQPWFNFVDKDGNLTTGPHPMMPQSKLCALTGLSVNAAPSNNFVTTKDGSIPIQTVNMSFLETSVLTQSDLETGNF